MLDFYTLNATAKQTPDNDMAAACLAKPTPTVNSVAISLLENIHVMILLVILH